MVWFEFNQNNTGGSFEVNEMVCHRVYIEAKDADEANKIAIDMGIYFDGCSTGMDCFCCGDRWYPARGDGDSFPYKYDKDEIFKTPKEYMQAMADKYGWTSPDARIYYEGGKKVDEIFSKKRKAA